MKHTPGNWILEERKTQVKIGDIFFATVGVDLGTKGVNWEEGKANARLISAAPELLEALILILPLAKGYAANNQVGSNQKYINEAEQAILKAEGE